MYLTLFRNTRDEMPPVLGIDENAGDPKEQAVNLARRYECIGGRLTGEPEREGTAAVAPLAHSSWTFWLAATGVDLGHSVHTLAPWPARR